CSPRRVGGLSRWYSRRLHGTSHKIPLIETVRMRPDSTAAHYRCDAWALATIKVLSDCKQNRPYYRYLCYRPWWVQTEIILPVCNKNISGHGSSMYTCV